MMDNISILVLHCKSIQNDFYTLKRKRTFTNNIIVLSKSLIFFKYLD